MEKIVFKNEEIELLAKTYLNLLKDKGFQKRLRELHGVIAKEEKENECGS